VTRREFVALAGAGLAGLLAPRSSARTLSRLARAQRKETAAPAYVSRPDLNPPGITITTPADGTRPGYIFLAPYDITASPSSYQLPASESHSGPLIVDDRGEPVWFLPLAKQTAMNLRVQKFRGRHVLTWYEGTVLGPYGGDFVIFDPAYHILTRVKAGRGRHADLHEFLLTPRDTALISIYNELRADLSSVGGAVDGRLVQGIVQEVEVTSGHVLFEWRSHEHVSLGESFETELTPAGNVDYFHLNSIALEPDGNLLVSARNTSTVYKIDRERGDVIWRLGGKRSDFVFGEGASFAYQHDARRHADGTLTIFDNAAAGAGPDVASRGIRLSLDMQAMRAELLQEWKPDDPRAGWAMGNVQQLSDGGVFIGWGTDGSFSEFGPDGRLRFDGRFVDRSVDYRAFRFPWIGRPTGEPAVAVVLNGDATMTVHASWNGTTEVAGWQVRTGPSGKRLQAVASAARSGFETRLTIPAAPGYLSVAALDAAGKQLGASTPIAVSA
jgi:hypothetical protein